MKPEIVAHRGVPNELPENTLASFRRAFELGADAIEFDVRLTSDLRPVVYHYFYLEEATNGHGPVFEQTLEAIRQLEVGTGGAHQIPTFEEVLAEFAGRIGLEIEIKGPEPEAVDIISDILSQYRGDWGSIEITSFDPATLNAVSDACPEIPVDLLFPRSEPWMRQDVIAHAATHLARLAGARAVHLHPSQLSEPVLKQVSQAGIEVHSWDVSNREKLEKVFEFQVPKFDTEILIEALEYRDGQDP